MDISLFELDRTIAKAEAARRRALSELEQGFDVANPLEPYRRVSSKNTLLELHERSELEQRIREFVGELIVERVTFLDRVRLVRAWNDQRIELSTPNSEVVSAKDLLLRVLSERSDELAAVWSNHLASSASASKDAFWIWRERRAEARSLLKLGPALPECPSKLLRELAFGILEATADVRGGEQEGEAGLLRSLLCSDVEGFPGRITTRWLEQTLGGHSGLFRGLQLDVGRLPRALGAASFVRAFRSVGEACFDATRPPSSFALSTEPSGLTRGATGALFATVLIEPLFHEKSLGVSRGRSRDQARRIGRATLMSLRLLAVIALLCDPELSRRSDLEERFRELTDQALGLSFSRGFAGVVPRVIEERGTEFLASLLASEKRFRLRDAFDEDWFHNPRAAESLRDGLSRMPIRPSEADFRAGLSSALAWVRELGV